MQTDNFIAYGLVISLW